MELLKQLEAAQARLAEMETSAAASATALAAMTAERDALITAKAEAITLGDAAKAEAKAAADLLAAEKTAHEATKADLALKVKALANPAFAAAAVQGVTTPTAEGGTATQAMTRDELEAEYAKLPDGQAGAQARQAFRDKHWMVLGLPEPK